MRLLCLHVPHLQDVPLPRRLLHGKRRVVERNHHRAAALRHHLQVDHRGARVPARPYQRRRLPFFPEHHQGAARGAGDQRVLAGLPHRVERLRVGHTMHVVLRHAGGAPLLAARPHVHPRGGGHEQGRASVACEGWAAREGDGGDELRARLQRLRLEVGLPPAVGLRVKAAPVHVAAVRLEGRRCQGVRRAAPNSVPIGRGF
mmetsp:Transcript_3785/g.9703  ORF Transcript_3785/g.9703 Transcript_3785/m.9703 type:complete len:202 (+) Transcript_3785:1262-1867(+)